MNCYIRKGRFLGTVFRIFKSDINAIVRHFFVVAIILAISVLPALYAWVNIYANGDPYVNTGNIKIALASKDPGLTLEDGKHVNSTNEIFEELKGSTSIGWQFPDSAEDAIAGVESGEYYAAIVFEDNFTSNMYNFEQALTGEDAPLTYYENAKKNAVASKITQTAASTLLERINTKYLETVFGILFDKTGEVADELEDGDTVEGVLARLRDMRDTLREYDRSIDSFLANSENVSNTLQNAETELDKTRARGRTSVTNAEANLKEARKAAASLNKELEKRQTRMDTRIEKLETAIDKLKDKGIIPDSEEQQKLANDAADRAEELLKELEALRAIIPDDGTLPGSRAISDALNAMIESSEDIETTIRETPERVEEMTEAIKSIRNWEKNGLRPGYKKMVANLDSTIKSLGPMVEAISGMLDDITPVLHAAGDTVSSLDASLIQMQLVFRSAADRIDDIIAQVENAEEDDRLELLTDLLGGDPELYAKFFSSLVDVEVEEIYPVASYGAAMSPFYSVLAIWVGGVILVSILKTGVDKKKFPNASESQCYFGRLLIFLLVGQLQAAVIVAGDIFLLGCSPVHPWLMWFAAAVTSVVFVLFIYSLTIAFGDVGKAIVVVVMVLQIAGSSGSYPIEILPEIFAKIYRFFPFPYAINAMREALCGTYGHDYWIYLGELLLFGVLGLVIGLFVRRPFIGMNRFVSEKLEDTGVL